MPPRGTKRFFSMKYLIVIMVMLVSVSVIYCPSRASEGNVRLLMELNRLSADIDNAPLKDVLTALQAHCGIWAKGDMPSLDTPVSVKFGKKSVEDGLKRILNRLNYAIIYNKDTPEGIYLFSEGKPSGVMNINPQGARSMPVTRETVNVSKMRSSSEGPSRDEPLGKGSERVSFLGDEKARPKQRAAFLGPQGDETGKAEKRMPFLGPKGPNK